MALVGHVSNGHDVFSPHVILVVEDDEALRNTVAYNLRTEGYLVLTAADGAAGLRAARENTVSLVLLDLMLPRLDGLEITRRLRAEAGTERLPILMMTARDEEMDKVIGLELGADDYVTKPFSWQELRARIRALLRRSPQTAVDDTVTTMTSPTTGVLAAEDVRIDVGRREVQKGDRSVELPARLFDLLVYLVRNKGLVLTRDRLLQHVWGYDYSGDTRTVDVHVRWLRERIEDDPSTPQLILTVRGVGYRFRG